MVRIVMPEPREVPKEEWSKLEKEAGRRARKVNKFIEGAHKKAAKSKLRFGDG